MQSIREIREILEQSEKEASIIYGCPVAELKKTYPFSDCPKGYKEAKIYQAQMMRSKFPYLPDHVIAGHLGITHTKQQYSLFR